MALFDRPFVLGGHRMTVSASIGVSLFPTGAGDIKTLLSYADMAMYQAKQDGRHDYRFFDPEMKARLQEFNLTESRLRKALQARDILVHFQPKYSVAKERFIGFEGLARWSARHSGPIDTEQIIKIAEESGLIIQLGEQVRRIACKTAAGWQRFGQPVSPAVNVSIMELLQQDFAPRLFELLDDTGLDPSLLQLEITENMFHRHGHRKLDALDTLRDGGVKLAIDDFGKGFSSLSRLQVYPIDSLKIDRSFVAGLGSDAKARAVVASIVALGHSLGMEVIAEGVETQEQFEILVEIQADQMQGFFFHPALPAADAEQLIQLQATSEAPATTKPRLEVVSSDPEPRAEFTERSGVGNAQGGANIASRNYR
jgi:EAL domain-containing protein (putative c-di-GMP-specific phosphodiesterase class I)